MPAHSKYPHLLPPDIPVWELFLDLYAHRFDAIDYDVRVGEGRPNPNLETANLRRMATDLSQRRIDAIAHKGSVRILIEITHHLGLKALGQIHAYPVLYRQKYPGTYTLQSLIVAGELGTDIHPVIEQLKIPHWTPTLGLHFMDGLKLSG